MKKERRNGKHTLKSSPSAIGSDWALTAGVRILSVIVIRAIFNDETTLTSSKKVFSIALFVFTILLAVNALLAGRSLIRRGAITKWAYIAGAALMVLIIGSVKTMFGNEQAQDEERWKLVKVAEEINRDEALPRNEGGARIERVVASGKMLTFTFTSLSLTSADADRDASSRMVTAFKNQKCGTSLVKETISAGGSLHYRWVGKDGGVISELLLIPGTCDAN
jgi:hypothetical protein